MTARKEQPYLSRSQLVALLGETSTRDHRARDAIRRAIRYRDDPEYRLREINKRRDKVGRPRAKSLDEIDRRVERSEAQR